MKEIKAEQLYKQILKTVVIPLVGDDVTYLTDLERIGHLMFGVHFKGVYPSDKIPKLNDLKKYCILNLDRSDEPGSHWVALAKTGNKTYFYDSFGRKNSKILKNLEFSGNGRIIDTDKDVEQHFSENNCGARCCAWLLFFDRYGAKNAMLI